MARGWIGNTAIDPFEVVLSGTLESQIGHGGLTLGRGRRGSSRARECGCGSDSGDSTYARSAKIPPIPPTRLVAVAGRDLLTRLGQLHSMLEI